MTVTDHSHGRRIQFFAALLCTLLFFSGTAVAQSVTVSIDRKDATLKSCLDDIEKQTSYLFVYDESLDLSRKVTVKAKDKSLESVLKTIFSGTDVTFTIEGRQISLKNAVKPAVGKGKLSGGTHTLIGVVVDADSGEPLPGVVVGIKGRTDAGTSTDIDGRFSIELPLKNTDIFVSCLGYITQELSIGDIGVISVKLQGDNTMLEGSVVVGAGRQKKISISGSISTIEGDVIKSPSSSLTSNLAGKLSGVIAKTNSGEPGAASEFYIRGIGTFGGRATPLILLDDVEISTDDLNRLPSESIESFSILKDASATAIYGARGANGVMLVTTKRGVENTRAKVSFKLENSFQVPVNMIEYTDGATWMQVYNEALLSRSPNSTPKYSNAVIGYTRDGINPYVYPDVDWYDLMFNKFSTSQRMNVNLQGGGSKVIYYMGLQVNHDSGILKVPKTYSIDSNINNWNYIFQNNLSYKPYDSMVIDLHINAQFGNNKGPGQSTSNIFYAVYDANPVSFPATFPAEEGDTHIRFGSSILSGQKLCLNPYANMMSSFSETNFSTINAMLKLNQDLSFITEGLSATALVNMKSYAQSSYTNTITPFYYRAVTEIWDPSDPGYYKLQLLREGTDHISQGGINRYADRTFYMDARLNYSRTFEGHSVSAMLMYMMREYRNDVLPNRNQGLSGRATYGYKNKYFAEFNFGYNGTERIEAANRFELFPAMSLAWVVSGENFWAPISKVISHFKLRGSYGLVGSDETGLLAGASHFLYRNTVALRTGYTFSTGANDSMLTTYNGPSFLSYAVDNACWEKAKKLDVGIDMQLFNQVDIVVDGFYDRRYDILMQRASWPSIMGTGSAVPWSNIGKVDNMGVEVSANWKTSPIKDMFLEFRGSFTYTQNKYVYVDEPDYPYVWQTKTGKPLAATYGYIAEGLFSSQEEIDNSPSQLTLGSVTMPGDIRYRDVNGDGLISSEDQVMISRYGSTPAIQYGLGLSFSYKGFDAGAFFTGSALRRIMINTLYPFCTGDVNQDRNLVQWVADNYWSEKNPDPNAAYPRLGVTDGQISNNYVPSTYWLRNGNFIRFKTLEFGYTYKWFRFYLNFDNIAVWSKFKLWDPELSMSAYPLQFTSNLGVQIKF